MVRLSRKGDATFKAVGRTSVGLTEDSNVKIRLDDIELEMAPDRARSMALKLFQLLRMLDKKRIDASQQVLPLQPS